MTDDEIIKYMQCVIGNEVSCSECKYQKVLPFPSCRMMFAKNALDLINRQKAIIEKSEKVEHFADKTIEAANAEIERLNIELQSMRSAANSYKMHYEKAQTEIERLIGDVTTYKVRWAKAESSKETAKSEAIKEFAKRLKHFIIPQKADGYTREIVLKRDIDNLVKEMTEVNENE